MYDQVPGAYYRRSDALLLRTLANIWMVPPAINVALMLLGLVVIRWQRKLGLLICSIAVGSLWLLSTLVVSSYLAVSIETHPAADPEAIKKSKSEAIIVLGASHLDMATEFGVSTPTDAGLVRLHYAASLHNRTGLPIMLTGGRMNRLEVHADVLGESLQSQFGIVAKWYERKSSTIWQNALFSAEILHPDGITDIVLITHAYHMQRAVNLYELAGFSVTPAPTRLHRVYPWRSWLYWMPSVQALELSSSVIHEYLGLLWYRLFSPAGDASEREMKVYAS